MARGKLESGRQPKMPTTGVVGPNESRNSRRGDPPVYHIELYPPRGVALCGSPMGTPSRHWAVVVAFVGPMDEVQWAE